MRSITPDQADFFCDIQLPCFQTLSSAEIEFVQSAKAQVEFRKGETITKQGSFSSYVLFVIDGWARQFVEFEMGKNYNLSIIKPGDFVGLSAIFSKQTFLYSAVALSDLKAYLIEKSALKEIVQHNGAFAFNLFQKQCELQAGMLDSIKGLAFKQINGRIADVILYLNSFKKNQPHIFDWISRRDLAEFAGISMESAVKTLKQFEKDQIISLLEKNIIVLNESKLSEISHLG
jgi:CRP-like cAMP-binding protein